jgi:hypothetical protein
MNRGKGLARSSKPMRNRSTRKAGRDAELDNARVIVLARDRGECQFWTRVGCAPASAIAGWAKAPPHRCGRGVIVHHIRRRKNRPDDHDPAHMVTLCRDHHDYVHANPAASYEVGLLARTTQENRNP